MAVIWKQALLFRQAKYRDLVPSSPLHQFKMILTIFIRKGSKLNIENRGIYLEEQKATMKTYINTTAFK